MKLRLGTGVPWRTGGKAPCTSLSGPLRSVGAQHWPVQTHDISVAFVPSLDS